MNLLPLEVGQAYGAVAMIGDDEPLADHGVGGVSHEMKLDAEGRVAQTHNGLGAIRRDGEVRARKRKVEAGERCTVHRERELMPAGMPIISSGESIRESRCHERLARHGAEA